jgi:hypothetical protein
MARTTVRAPVITQDGDRQIVKVPVNTVTTIIRHPVVIQDPDPFHWVIVPVAPTGR